MESSNPQPTPRPSARPPRVNIFGSVLGWALLLATLFTAWAPNTLLAGSLQSQLDSLLTPQPAEPVTGAALTQRPQLRIGIVAGHSGNDSGAVCTNEAGEADLTEAAVNMAIATRVKDSLVQKGYQVDLLNEFDTRLNGYRAAALVSIHNDSCQYVNDEATGFKVAASLDTRDVNLAQRLTACLTDRYRSTTGLTFHSGSITVDMTQYHAFSEIDPSTTTAIIETGFLYLDREILTTKTDLVADGVTKGILCFLTNETVLPTPLTP